MHAPPPSPPPLLLIRLMSRRRTWFILFLILYSLLLYSSLRLLRSFVLSSLNGDVFSAIYASLLLGLAFGLLSMIAALGVAVPAMLVTWITVLVLLAFSGKRRRELVVEGRKLTAEIGGCGVRILVKEGNVVAAVCAVVGYFLIVRRGGGESAAADR